MIEAQGLVRRTLNKLSRSYVLISQHSDWFATRDRAMGKKLLAETLSPCV